MKERIFFEDQNDEDDDWYDEAFSATRKVPIGKLPRQRGQRSDGLAWRRAARRAKMERVRIH